MAERYERRYELKRRGYDGGRITKRVAEIQRPHLHCRYNIGLKAFGLVISQKHSIK